MKPLSPAEEEVVERVARGDTDKRIALDLGKGHLTVRDQIQSARQKLGAKTRAHLVSLWLKAKPW